MITLLITSLGSNTSISVIKALRLIENFEVRIIGTDSNGSEFCAGATMVDVFYQTPNVIKQSIEFERVIIDIIAKEKVDCVIPIHDLEIEVCAQLSEKYKSLTFWAVNPPEIIELCADKRAINNVLEKAGINVPKKFNSIEQVSVSDLPIIVKPNKGVSSAGISIIKTKEDLLFIKSVSDSSFLIQEFVQGKEYTIDCYNSYKNGEFAGCCVRERVETKAGISTKGIIIKHELLSELCKKILSILNYRGASNIQFIIRDGKPFFIEINPRFSGAGILSFKGNFNSPYFTLLESTGKNIPENISDNITYGLKMTRYWQEVFS